jgi:hypothetical protein
MKKKIMTLVVCAIVALIATGAMKTSPFQIIAAKIINVIEPATVYTKEKTTTVTTMDCNNVNNTELTTTTTTTTCGGI